MKKAFKMSVRIKRTENVFGEGLEPGVIATQVVEYNAEPSEYERPGFILSLIDKQDEMLKEHVEVLMEEVEE